jgi:pimeloyl-ACP methyl ester carboxylesterase
MVSDAQLADLRQRLTRTRGIETDLWEGWSGGTDPVYLRSFADHWLNHYDWRKQETSLNALHQFIAPLDGQTVHFLHERAEGGKGLPIILAHGWPSTFLEMSKIVPRLTHPSRFGGDPADAFDVVVPSPPGFAFSSAPKTRQEYYRTARVWNALMVDVLGYPRYAAHGGDLGVGIVTSLGQDYPDRLAGIHLTAVGSPVAFESASRSLAEKKYFEQESAWDREEGAYQHLQMTRPLTIAQALNDSPVGLAAYLVEKYRAWSDCGGNIESRFDKDFLITNIMLYWITGSIGTSFLPYFAYAHDRPPVSKRVDVPCAFALFPADLSHPPRELAERGYDVRRWTTMPRGGHFAAYEEPDLLAHDLREFFRPLRE